MPSVMASSAIRTSSTMRETFMVMAFQSTRLASVRATASSTRTATDEPTRPMRPFKSGTPPQRSSMVESGPELSITVWPTYRFMIVLSDMICSSRIASISTRVDHNSVARWLSQIESRPNFSPMNCCRSNLRIGSSVA